MRLQLGAPADRAVSTISSPRMRSMSPPLKTLWSFYLLAILTLGVGRTIEKMARDSGGFGSRYGPAIGAIAFAIGVAGHVWGRRIGHQLIWRAVFALSLLASPGLLFLEVTLLMGDGAPIRIHAIILTGVLLLVPGQVALYRYGFRRPDVWRRIAPTSPGRR